jgi:outer membrane immunogenic protein
LNPTFKPPPKEQASFSNPFSVNDSFPGGNILVGTTTIGYTTKLEWFGTVRGRIGYVWGNGNLLTYVSGGLAYGKGDLEATNVVNASLNGHAQVLVSQAFGHSRVNTGYVAGVGTEGPLDGLGARNWTWK